MFHLEEKSKTEETWKQRQFTRIYGHLFRNVLIQVSHQTYVSHGVVIIERLTQTRTKLAIPSRGALSDNGLAKECWAHETLERIFAQRDRANGGGALVDIGWRYLRHKGTVELWTRGNFPTIDVLLLLLHDSPFCLISWNPTTPMNSWPSFSWQRLHVGVGGGHRVLLANWTMLWRAGCGTSRDTII
jgi:hypothetical protein